MLRFSTGQFILFKFHHLLVISPETFHRGNDGAHGFTQSAQRILNSRWNFGINRSCNDAVLLHRPKAVGKHFLADSIKAFLSLLKRQGLARRFRRIRSFHLLPISWTVVATGQSGSSSFVFMAHLQIDVTFQNECNSQIRI